MEMLSISIAGRQRAERSEGLRERVRRSAEPHKIAHVPTFHGNHIKKSGTFSALEVCTEVWIHGFVFPQQPRCETVESEVGR